MTKHLFFDLDRTLWDFDRNSKQFKENNLATIDLSKKGKLIKDNLNLDLKLLLDDSSLIEV